ncbi:hypothetical protein HRI96_00565 [Treponema parvum]|uniref:HEAT repeat domain-containing protein n=2 Tax=Treponema parvum TaxID=138851 RepID=A0A975EXT1_9SPIR|nr:hypothetical protein HRI96_00565 [Treponema parvum]
MKGEEKMDTVQQLKQNSHLPGPRANLELLYSFSKTATKDEINECLALIRSDTENSPDEFAGMCGIVAYAVYHQNDSKATIDFIARYASHKSWRIREAVAIAIQELAKKDVTVTLKNITNLKNGNCCEKRAVVAGLCEPKLLKDKTVAVQVIRLLDEITATLAHNDKLTDEEDTLKKALGYGWSVAIVHAPAEGKEAFEKLLKKDSKHIKWIIKENLKKNRLIKADGEWVRAMESKLS